MSMKVEDAPKEQLSTKLLPQSLYVMWMLTFLTVGIYATTQDDSLKSHSCGKQTHLWKYSLWSTSFCGFCLSTFFVFPGGGEAARARAVLLSIVHAGFGMWGVLMWRNRTEECVSVIASHYRALATFHDISVVHNLFFGVLFVVHEAYLGRKLGADFTLMSEIHAPKVGEEDEPPKDIDAFGFSGSQGVPQGLMYHQTPSYVIPTQQEEFAPAHHAVKPKHSNEEYVAKPVVDTFADEDWTQPIVAQPRIVTTAVVTPPPPGPASPREDKPRRNSY